MRTLIRGSWVVGFDGQEHRLVKDGVVVYEDDRIVHVGKSYNDDVDEVIDAKRRLVIPGLVNIHAVSSICIVHFRIDGVGIRESSSPNLSVDERIRNPQVSLTGEDLRTSAEFCFAELLKGGATTIGEITAFGTTGIQPPIEQAETFVEMAGKLGARAYISHPYTDMKKYSDKEGTQYHYAREAGLRALGDAVKFCKDNEGIYEDRVKTMLFPYMFDACSEELLRETRKKADELEVPIHMHTAQYLPEFYESIRRYGKTPVHFLHDIGFLKPKTILTHLLFTSYNPVSQAPNSPVRDPRDIEILAKTGTTIGHTPAVWARVGLGLQSYAKFRDSGVNIAIGTDSYPMDMLMEMRYAAIMGKIAERNRTAVTAKDVFNAATLGGAKALGRNDLGRLSPGAKADVVIVDLTGLHTALTHDPIKTLVYFSSQRDVETVIIDGKKVVDKGKIPGLNEEKLAKRADEVNQRWVKSTGMKYPPSFKEWSN